MEQRERIVELTREYVRAKARKQWRPGVDLIPYADASLGENEIASLVDTALGGWLTLGPKGDIFEKKLKDRIGVRDVVLVNSGSSANLIAVSSLCSQLIERPLMPGDEVIVPATSFPTTVAPLIQNGLVPVFVDCETGTYNANLDEVERAVSASTKVKAIVLSHTLGNVFDLDRVVDLCRKWTLYLIEDCCDALGSTWSGRSVGTFGDFASLSFYPSHHITTGEGGAVLTNKARYGKTARTMRDWGRDCFPAGTPVICKDAIRPIENVLIGHEVLTHAGRWQRVHSLTGHRSYSRPMVTIKAHLRPAITVSANHRFWILRGTKRTWAPASSLKSGDSLIARTIPTSKMPPATYSWAYKTLYKDAVQNTVNVDPDLLRLMGYWLAQGSLASGKRGKDGFLAYRVDFSFHEDHTEYHDDVATLLRRYFGCSGFIRRSKASRAVTISCKSRRGYEFFLKTIGRGAVNKRLPSWVFDLSDQHIAQLLCGHWRGDGSSSDQGHSVHSVSFELIEQLRLLMLRLGILASQWKREVSAHTPCVVNGRVVTARQALHALSIYGENAARFADVIGESYVAKTSRKNASVDRSTGEALYPVISTEEHKPKEKPRLYNLEVEVDNSYHAGGVAVHNCWCATGVSNTCGKRFGWKLGDLPEGYDHKYVYSAIGYNVKPTDLQASIGLVQVDRLPEFIRKRKENFNRLREGLESLPWLMLPRWDPRADVSWFSFPISVHPDAPFGRRELVAFLEGQKIDTRMLFAGNLIRQPGYRTIRHRVFDQLNTSDFVMDSTFMIGVHPGITTEMIDFMVLSIRKFVGENWTSA